MSCTVRATDDVGAGEALLLLGMKTVEYLAVNCQKVPREGFVVVKRAREV